MTNTTHITTNISVTEWTLWWYLINSLRQSDTSLTQWGNWTIIGSYNSLSPGQRQAIIWTNAGIMLIGLLGTKFNEMLIEIPTFSFKKIHLKMPSGKWRPFCRSLNVLTRRGLNKMANILQRTFGIFLKAKFFILILISQKFRTKCLTDSQE